MKSIRLSLVTYFLILLTGALGAVSWLVYKTASRTMMEKEQSTRKLFEANCEADIKVVHELFNQRLLAEAEKLASLSKENSQHHEFYYPFGMLAVPAMPYAHFLMPLWVAEGTHGLLGRLSPESTWNAQNAQVSSWLSEASSDKLAARLQLSGSDSHADPDDPTRENTAGRAHQYLQIERPLFHYQSERRFGAIPKRLELLEQLKQSYMVKQFSESLEGKQLPMSDKERLELEDHHFDEFALTPTTTVRRVTIKRYAGLPRSGRVLRFSADGRRMGAVWWQPREYGPEPKNSPKGTKGPPNKGTPNPGWGQYASYWDYLPFVFIHYAEDTAARDHTILELKSKRDQKLTELSQETLLDLADLRQQLWWIGLVTFFGILIGSWLVIRLGLAPLARLSNAVSKVTPRDFRLHIDPENLPSELIPIADRMSATLEQLGKAFAREKQAAADISHELRTPLAALLTTAEVGLKKPRTSEEYRELLQDCRLSGEQMMQLVERLLALARLDANADCLRPTPVDVGNLAQQCADMVRPLADARGLNLQVRTEGSLSVQADGGKIREVLTNLLHNAIQYNKPAGSIDLTVQRQNGHVLMEVRDTGIGISPEARAHIFERFYRADPSRHSDTPHAGLGLAIVKSYVDLMGGRIDVDSDSGGSTFRVEVPAVPLAV